MECAGLTALCLPTTHHLGHWELSVDSQDKAAPFDLAQGAAALHMYRTNGTDRTYGLQTHDDGDIGYQLSVSELTTDN